MNWEKIGQVYNVNGKLPWASSHAMIPTPIALEDRIRVFFGTRGTNGKASISFVDLDINDPSQIIAEHDRPVLSHGQVGCFDDCGVLPGCLVKTEDRLLMYYVGFNVRNTVPYSNAIGVAESFDDGITFQRVYEGAVVDRTKDEPYFSVSPCVISDGKSWKMYYASCTEWISVNDKYEALYHIKMASSSDGFNWDRPNISCILPLKDDESNARPTVFIKDGIFHMYYSYRGSSDFRDGVDSYRLGYAISQDGEHWERKDSECGIGFSEDGWDSKMLAYPSVLEVGQSTYLFYNGNGFGQTGFGIAKMV
ncbi:MAG: hypothetical protein ABJF11_17460 [Reichenbachiella sp.]|uniref:hypothetical protein n=1 Tax=Reichenbachiella sp. TaxID=2184521 RepID=UPI0032659E39